MPNDFTPPSEELPRLAEEINLLRRDFQTGIATLSRIEKRLRAAFPTYAPKKLPRAKSSSEPRSASTKTEHELNTTFDSLLAATKERGDIGFETSVSALPDQDLIALAHELGIGTPKAPSIKKARAGIRKRIQDSLLLTYQRKNDSQQ
jgi:hypothetical protein